MEQKKEYPLQKIWVWICASANETKREREWLLKYVFPELQRWSERWRLQMVVGHLLGEVIAIERLKKLSLRITKAGQPCPIFLCLLDQEGWKPTKETSKSQYFAFLRQLTNLGEIFFYVSSIGKIPQYVAWLQEYYQQQGTKESQQRVFFVHGKSNFEKCLKLFGVQVSQMLKTLIADQFQQRFRALWDMNVVRPIIPKDSVLDEFQVENLLEQMPSALDVMPETGGRFYKINVLLQKEDICNPLYLNMIAYHWREVILADKTGKIAHHLPGKTDELLLWWLVWLVMRHEDHYPGLIGEIFCRLKQESLAQLKETLEIEKLAEFLFISEQIQKCFFTSGVFVDGFVKKQVKKVVSQIPSVFDVFDGISKRWVLGRIDPKFVCNDNPDFEKIEEHLEEKGSSYQEQESKFLKTETKRKDVPHIFEHVWNILEGNTFECNDPLQNSLLLTGSEVETISLQQHPASPRKHREDFYGVKFYEQINNQVGEIRYNPTGCTYIYTYRGIFDNSPIMIFRPGKWLWGVRQFYSPPQPPGAVIAQYIGAKNVFFSKASPECFWAAIIAPPGVRLRALVLELATSGIFLCEEIALHIAMKTQQLLEKGFNGDTFVCWDGSLWISPRFYNRDELESITADGIEVYDTFVVDRARELGELVSGSLPPPVFGYAHYIFMREYAQRKRGFLGYLRSLFSKKRKPISPLVLPQGLSIVFMFTSFLKLT